MAEIPMVYRASDELAETFPFKIYTFEGLLTQPLHVHDYFQIWFVRHGICTHWMNGQPHELTTGSIFVLPPDISHYMECKNSETSLVGMEFTEAFIQPDVGGNSFWDTGYLEPFSVSLDQVKPRFPLEGAAAKNVEAIFDEMIWEFRHQEAGYQLFIRADVLKVLAIISRQYGKTLDEARQQYLDRYKDSVARAVAYINDHFQKKIYLEEVARIAMMSATSFSCVFKEATGRTFTEQLNFLRVRKAKELLKDPNRTVRAIAYEVGFQDIAYFDRVFKREVGVTPRSYRQNL